MKAPGRHDGVVHDRVDLPNAGGLFDATVIGPDPSDLEDSISFMASGMGVNVSLRFSRDEARRVGELLIAAADDGISGSAA